MTRRGESLSNRRQPIKVDDVNQYTKRSRRCQPHKRCNPATEGSQSVGDGLTSLTARNRTLATQNSKHQRSNPRQTIRRQIRRNHKVGRNARGSASYPRVEDARKKRSSQPPQPAARQWSHENQSLRRAQAWQTNDRRRAQSLRERQTSAVQIPMTNRIRQRSAEDGNGEDSAV
jgi:hypothetical protein